MPLIKPVKGISPTFGKNVFIAENATIVGDVVTGDDCSIWFNAVLRGDVNSIVMGNKVNIQDGAVVLEKAQLESGFIYAGVPAKKVKALTPETFQHYIGRIADNYVMYASWFGEENP